MESNDTDAAEAIVKAYDYFARAKDPEAPWRLVGCGSFRSVWAKGEGATTVYKVPHLDDPTANVPEWSNYNIFAPDVPFGMRFPTMRPHYVQTEDFGTVLIIAAERIFGVQAPWESVTAFDSYIKHKMGLYDAWGPNVVTEEDGTVVFLDIAM